LSLHYWDWTDDPRHIPDANLGHGRTGPLNLFTDDFMGYGGRGKKPIGPKWRDAGFYDPDANPARTDPFDPGYNAADTPASVERSVAGPDSPPLATKRQDRAVVAADDYLTMSGQQQPNGALGLEGIHDLMHGYVDMGDRHTSFRDPFVFLLHSNVDRLFALWQTQPGHKERLDPDHVYGRASHNRRLNGNIEPWSTGHSKDNEFHLDHYTRPWYQPESLGVPIKYKDPSIVTPRRYAKSVHHPS
jgi:tyrosinase-like protein